MTSLSHLFKRVLPVLLVGLMALMPAKEAAAQIGEDLYLYGFFQGQYRYSDIQGNPDRDEVSSFSLQQLNAFLMKEFDASFSAFVNVELTNTFSTDQDWGSLNLEEAWVRYNHSSAFQVRAGLLVPKFNNLNEVKNRTPLLPYAFRPFAYESSYAETFDLENMTPDQAYAEVSGNLPVGPLKFEYATYIGNNGADYASAGEGNSSLVSGMDTSIPKLIGGRAGLRWRGFKGGVSATQDQRKVEYNLVELTGMPAEALGQAGIPATVSIGDLTRTRLGADLSFYHGDFFGEAEYITVLQETDDEQDAKLALISQSTGGLLMDRLDADFYYGMLGYNITDALYAYGMYSKYSDAGANAVQGAGLDSYSVGGGFRPIDGLVAKAQYMRTTARENLLAPDYGLHTFLLALSVSF